MLYSTTLFAYINKYFKSRINLLTYNELFSSDNINQDKRLTARKFQQDTHNYIEVEMKKILQKFDLIHYTFFIEIHHCKSFVFQKSYLKMFSHFDPFHTLWYLCHYLIARK